MIKNSFFICLLSLSDRRKKEKNTSSFNRSIGWDLSFQSRSFLFSFFFTRPRGWHENYYCEKFFLFSFLFFIFLLHFFRNFFPFFFVPNLSSFLWLFRGMLRDSNWSSKPKKHKSSKRWKRITTLESNSKGWLWECVLVIVGMKRKKGQS